MGQAGKDIILRGEARKRFLISIECKNSETLNLYKAIEQAKNNMETYDMWMVIHKKKNSKPIAIIEWEELRSLYYREYNE